MAVMHPASKILLTVNMPVVGNLLSLRSQVSSYIPVVYLSYLWLPARQLLHKV